MTEVTFDTEFQYLKKVCDDEIDSLKEMKKTYKISASFLILIAVLAKIFRRNDDFGPISQVAFMHVITGLILVFSIKPTQHFLEEIRKEIDKVDSLAGLYRIKENMISYKPYTGFYSKKLKEYLSTGNVN